MDALTQDLLAAGLLLLAVSYLAWRGYRTLRGKKTGCGCDTCPAVKPKVPQQP
jgi:hypothetical protein